MSSFNNKMKYSKKRILLAALFVALITTVSCVIFAVNNGLNTGNEAAVEEENIKNNEETCENGEICDNKENELKEDNADNLEKIDSNLKKNEENAPALDIDYTKLYPNLYCTRPETQVIPSKTIFLTFDDGPSEQTAKILKILDEKDVKATFFVTGNASANGRKLMQQIVSEGHTIAVHTYTHEFRQIYSSVSAFLDDFNRIYSLVYETTGVKPTIFRFPGGSKNSFNKDNYKEIIAEMKRRGFDYFDWNLSAGDAVSRIPTPTQKCINNVLNFSKNCDHGVVLMHDAKPKTTTVEALPHIIDGLRSQGFNFDKLSNKIDPAPYSLVKPYR